jgi:hypothetical protein
MGVIGSGPTGMALDQSSLETLALSGRALVSRFHCFPHPGNQVIRRVIQLPSSIGHHHQFMSFRLNGVVSSVPYVELGTWGWGRKTVGRSSEWQMEEVVVVEKVC